MECINNKPVLSEQLKSVLLFIATCGFIGYLPVMPGTYASVLGCFIVYFFHFTSLLWNIIFICCLTVCSILCINYLNYEGEDPSFIVIDEFLGMFITMTGHKADLLNIIIGFILFRLFDILKPSPIRNIEHFKKGYGIVGDDILAGIFANLLICLGYGFQDIF